MTKKNKSKKKGGSLFRLAIATALASGAGYFYATHKEDVDKEVKKRVDELAKMLEETKKDIEKRVKVVWGEVSKEAVEVYTDLRSSILESLEEENLHETGKLLRAKYDEIVKKVVKQAKKSGILTPEVEKRLEKLFKSDWPELRDILVKTAQKTGQEVGTAIKRSKAAKQVKKEIKKAIKEAEKTMKNAGKKKTVKKRKAVKKAKAGAKKTVKKAAKKTKAAAKKGAKKTKK